MRSTNIKGPIGTIHIIEASPPLTAGESEPLPVVFVHGMAVSASIWDAQLARVARTRRAIGFSLAWRRLHRIVCVECHAGCCPLKQLMLSIAT